MGPSASGFSVSHVGDLWRHDVPGDQKREYSGYAGTYTYDGKQLVTTVDAAPAPDRIGTKQPRGVRFENGLMIPSRRVVDGGRPQIRRWRSERVGCPLTR